MSRIVIEGSHRVNGSVKIQGAKNSALPILAATAISGKQSIIHNCPDLSDVDAAIKILVQLGCRVTREGGTVTVDSSTMDRWDIPDALMREMRSSIVFLGAIVSRCGKAYLSFPGGCELGPRPIDLHLAALRQLGLTICEDRGCLECYCEKPLTGAEIVLSFPSVGATENILLAACLAQGVTVIRNAAREPEICDLADFLNSCGARIYGAGESTVYIEGVETLGAAEHTVIADRIAGATYMAAAAATGGDIELTGICPAHLYPVIPIFEETGCVVSSEADSLHLMAPKKLQRIKLLRTMVYPGFPTDAQPPIIALAVVCEGTSVFIETIFENRFKHTGELARLGARIKVDGRVAVVEGVSRLSGCPVEATDLRGGAALIVAGLAAEGVTVISGVRHIDRGYERIEETLSDLSATIRREP